MGTSHHQIARAQCSAPSRRPLLNTTRGDYAKLGLVLLPRRWNATTLYACLSLRENHMLFRFFRLFNFLILNPMASNQPTSAHSYAPQHLSSLNIDYLNHRSFYSQVFSCIATATSLSLTFRRAEKKSLASCGTLQTRQCAMESRGQWTILLVNMYIGQMSHQIAVRQLSHRAGSAATRTLPCGGGDSVMDPGLLCQPQTPQGLAPGSRPHISSSQDPRQTLIAIFSSHLSIYLFRFTRSLTISFNN